MDWSLLTLNLGLRCGRSSLRSGTCPGSPRLSSSATCAKLPRSGPYPTATRRENPEPSSHLKTRALISVEAARVSKASSTQDAQRDAKQMGPVVVNGRVNTQATSKDLRLILHALRPV